MQQQPIAGLFTAYIPVRERVAARDEENARLLFSVCILTRASGQQQVWQTAGTIKGPN